jgi:hypothetical protein
MKLKLLILVLLTSCKTSNSLIGTYQKKGNDYKYELELKIDSTFLLSKVDGEVQTKCGGKWENNFQKTVILKCDEETLSQQLSSGYLKDRTQTVEIINFDKLKLSNIILKKQKPLN